MYTSTRIERRKMEKANNKLVIRAGIVLWVVCILVAGYLDKHAMISAL